tara:strand:- start:1859 stop:2497 length:639 start_codon:yes stop_codon:yes gene_type:complete
VQDFYTTNGWHVYIKEPMTNDVNAEEVIAQVEERLPQHLLSEVEMVIIGWFKEFEERDINAFYSDGCLHISNEQQNNEDFFDDIIHEIAHSLEIPHGYEIYGDRNLQNEFLKKRLQLRHILWAHGFKAPESFFTETEYNREFDDFLLNKIGYDKLALLMQGMFVSPYAATSLREYFATGFTEFYLDSDHNTLKEISPALYKKLIKLQGKKSS